MRIKPAGYASKRGGIDEDDDLDAARIDSESLGHFQATFESTNRATGSGIEEIARHPQARERDRPDQVVEEALVAKFQSKEVKGRNACQAGIAAKEIHVAEHVVEADAPGDCRQWQVMALHAKSDETEKRRDDRGQRDSGDNIEPRGDGREVER